MPTSSRPLVYRAVGYQGHGSMWASTPTLLSFIHKISIRAIVVGNFSKQASFRSSSKKAGTGAKPSLPLCLRKILFSTPRPNRPSCWRACRSRRRYRPGAPAGRGCSGRTCPPLPSFSARIPGRRTTWS